MTNVDFLMVLMELKEENNNSSLSNSLVNVWLTCIKVYRLIQIFEPSDSIDIYNQSI